MMIEKIMVRAMLIALVNKREIVAKVFRQRNMNEWLNDEIDTEEFGLRTGNHD